MVIIIYEVLINLENISRFRFISLFYLRSSSKKIVIVVRLRYFRVFLLLLNICINNDE